MTARKRTGFQGFCSMISEIAQQVRTVIGVKCCSYYVFASSERDAAAADMTAALDLSQGNK